MESMKKSAQKRSGDDKICEVGDVVHVALKNENKAKVDSDFNWGDSKGGQDTLSGACCCETGIVKVLVCVSQARPSDWKGQQCRIEWLGRCIAWVGVNKDHLGKGGREDIIYCGR